MFTYPVYETGPAFRQCLIGTEKNLRDALYAAEVKSRFRLMVPCGCVALHVQHADHPRSHAQLMLPDLTSLYSERNSNIANIAQSVVRWYRNNKEERITAIGMLRSKSSPFLFRDLL